MIMVTIVCFHVASQGFVHLHMPVDLRVVLIGHQVRRFGVLIADDALHFEALPRWDDTLPAHNSLFARSGCEGWSL